MTLDVEGPGLDSRLRKFFPFFFGCFVFVFVFNHTFSYLLAGSNLFTLLPFFYTFARCCDKRISSSYS